MHGRHRILTWPMVVAALLAGVVLAVASVPVAAVVCQYIVLSGPYVSPSIQFDIDRTDHVELIGLDRTIGAERWYTCMAPKPLHQAWVDSLSQWIEADDDPRPAFARFAFAGADRDVSCIRHGWPWLAGEGRRIGELTPPFTDRTQFLREVTFGSKFYRIPLRPIWPGLLANSLFYAALALAPMVLLRWRRTRLRRARGLCVACGYELGEGVAQCPECGLGEKWAKR